MEQFLGVPIGLSKVIPGTIARKGREIVYVSDDGKRSFRTQFRNLTKTVSPRMAKSGGKMSQDCRLWLPDGMLFHPIEYHGDLEGWRIDIENGARQHNLQTARIDGDRIIVSDGRSFLLSACTVKFYSLAGEV
jgi:Tol biopolymer transport system component